MYVISYPKYITSSNALLSLSDPSRVHVHDFIYLLLALVRSLNLCSHKLIFKLFYFFIYLMALMKSAGEKRKN